MTGSLTSKAFVELVVVADNLRFCENPDTPARGEGLKCLCRGVVAMSYKRTSEHHLSLISLPQLCQIWRSFVLLVLCFLCRKLSGWWIIFWNQFYCETFKLSILRSANTMSLWTHFWPFSERLGPFLTILFYLNIDPFLSFLYIFVFFWISSFWIVLDIIHGCVVLNGGFNSQTHLEAFVFVAQPTKLNLFLALSPPCA